MDTATSSEILYVCRREIWNMKLPVGYVFGCELSNGVDAVNDIDIQSGSWRDDTNVSNTLLPAYDSGDHLH
jgi:hypothetical protein